MIQHDLDGVAQQEPTAAGEFHQPLQIFKETIDFSDLGSGTSSAHSLTSFPTNVVIVACWIEIVTAFAGEGDVAVKVGDTADDDGLIASFNLDSVAAGLAGTTPGAFALPRPEADFDGDGADITFTATELDDVTAGNLIVNIAYFTPKLSTD